VLPHRRWLLGSILIVALVPAGPAAAQAPVGPPGPPPGAGSDLPAPPGTAPTVVPPGTPSAVPDGPAGPGLLANGTARLNRTTRSFSVALACQAGGSLSVSVRAISKAPLARSGYRCQGGRTRPALRVSAKVAKQLTRRRSVAALATVNQAGRRSRISFMLLAGTADAPAKGFWTDGHLQCTDSAGAPQAYLAEPDFTTATPTTISTRGWVAWSTPAGGWHWLGVGGQDAGRWDTWTATVSGVTQFHPGGATTPQPWTWGPISITPGQGIYAVGVYEIVYWVGGKPDYQWQYVNAGTTGAAAAGAGNLYCIY
jgi:hypothetical protein